MLAGRGREGDERVRQIHKQETLGFSQLESRGELVLFVQFEGESKSESKSSLRGIRPPFQATRP